MQQQRQHEAWARRAVRAVVQRAAIQADATLARFRLAADRLIARARRP